LREYGAAVKTSFLASCDCFFGLSTLHMFFFEVSVIGTIFDFDLVFDWFSLVIPAELLLR
jgi:hypothetical protein